MNKVECIFQSFEGAGSIYISSVNNLTTQHLKSHTTRALLHIASKNKLKRQNIKVTLLHQSFLKIDDITDKPLSPLFMKASDFIRQARKNTNIMIWCPQNRQLAITFAFAHLILRYGYKLDYIWRIYDQRILNINLHPHYIRQLQDLTKKEQVVEDIDQNTYFSVVEKRIQRVKNKYLMLSKDSQKISKEKKDQAITRNPQSPSRKGFDLDLIDFCYSQPCSTHRKSETSTYRQRRHVRGNSINLDF